MKITPILSCLSGIYLLELSNGFSGPFKNHHRTSNTYLSISLEHLNQNDSVGRTTSGRINVPSSPELFQSDCDDVNTPPSLLRIFKSFLKLKSGSDIRGTFVDHGRVGSIMNIGTIISSHSSGSPAPLTPFAAYCFGAAFAKLVKIRSGKALYGNAAEKETVICVGKDPRTHGVRLADSFARGVESVENCIAVYSGISSTPAMFEFCRADKCDGSVMVTASHLPEDRNGFKFFTRNGGLSKQDIDILTEGAMDAAREWTDIGLIPPTSGDGAVSCSEWVDHMEHYKETLREAINQEVTVGLEPTALQKAFSPLAGLKIVLNAGNGSGYFFNKILSELGADVSGSINLSPDGSFPVDAGVPNPESQLMVDATIRACENCNADLGIMLDTDADRAGFIVPTKVNSNEPSDYEPLNRNRLIALLSVIFSSTSPGCTIVTDSTTSEGLSMFLKRDLGLNHYRYIRGYANVIGKARSLTESGKNLVEVAIETSGHCAMRENGFLDDGTYTAVKVIGVLARMSRGDDEKSLIDLISGMKEMDETAEFRLNLRNGSQEKTKEIFDYLFDAIQYGCSTISNWDLDSENQEGIRVRNGGGGGFFMMRKSLHDPVIIFNVEGNTKNEIREKVVGPILNLIGKDGDQIHKAVDLSEFENY